MLPSRGARWSHSASSGVNIQPLCRHAARQFSIAARVPRRTRAGQQKSSVHGQSRAFSSTPLRPWSLWGNLTNQRSSSPIPSEFATTTSKSEYAVFQDGAARPTEVNQPSPVIEQSLPSTETSLPVDRIPTDSIAVSHHGSPLMGPEKLLPDPVTHHGVDLDLNSPIANIPEKIGYLKELGLDYGWGTSSPMQYLLESIHIYTGLPWYASAMAAAFIIRTCFFRMQMKNSDSMAKWAQMKPIHTPLMAQLEVARTEGDTFKTAQITKELRPLRNEAGMSLKNTIIPVIGQTTLGFGIWRNLRGMAELPIPALEQERFLWLKDLTLRDSTFGMAFAQAAAMYFTMKNNAATNAAATGQMAQFQEILRRALPVLSFAIVSFQPGIVQIYFVTSSLLNLTITSFIQNKYTRGWLGLTPNPPPEPELPPGPGGVMSTNPTVSSNYKAAQSSGIVIAPRPSATPVKAGKSTITKPISPRPKTSFIGLSLSRLGSYFTPKTSTSTPQAVAKEATSRATPPSSPPPPPQRKISIIDRTLTKLNTSAKSFMGPISGNATEKAEAKQAKVRAKREKERADQYEKTRRREIELERVKRNEQLKRVWAREKSRGEEMGMGEGIAEDMEGREGEDEEVSDRERPKGRGRIVRKQ